MVLLLFLCVLSTVAVMCTRANGAGLCNIQCYVTRLVVNIVSSLIYLDYMWAHQVKMGACTYDYNLRKWRLKMAVFAQGG